ncbi:MAG: hypothetical protein ABH837_01720 [bacterium]
MPELESLRDLGKPCVEWLCLDCKTIFHTLSETAMVYESSNDTFTYRHFPSGTIRTYTSCNLCEIPEPYPPCPHCGSTKHFFVCIYTKPFVSCAKLPHVHGLEKYPKDIIISAALYELLHGKCGLDMIFHDDYSVIAIFANLIPNYQKIHYWFCYECNIHPFMIRKNGVYLPEESPMPK